MFEIRIHGRGGQGVVTAAEMLSIAAFEEGKHSQASPSFGSEGMGAPMVAYVRIDDDPIELGEPVMSPNLLIIQGPTLFHSVYVFSGLAPDGFVLINTSREIEEPCRGLRSLVQSDPSPWACQPGMTCRPSARPSPSARLNPSLKAQVSNSPIPREITQLHL